MLRYMSRVKTDYRSAMSEESLDNQMRICMEGPEIENFSSACSLKFSFSKLVAGTFAFLFFPFKISAIVQYKIFVYSL